MNEYVHEYLLQYSRAKADQALIESKIKIIETEMFPKSPLINGIGGNGRSGDRMAEHMVKIEDYLDKLNKAKMRSIDAMVTVDELINKLEDVTLRRVLNYRYICGYPWQAIQEVMNYDRMQLSRLRNKALDELAAFIDDNK